MQHHATVSIHRRLPSIHFCFAIRWLTILTCLLFLCSSTVGCTWVSLTPGAAEIRVAPTERDVGGCKHIGDISARTKSKVGIIARNADQISEELATLARNEAVEMGADTILAVSPPTLEGVQKFRAYQCPPS